jgi:hypothetical protein
MRSCCSPSVCVSPTIVTRQWAVVSVCPPVILLFSMMSVQENNCSQNFFLSFVFTKIFYSPKTSEMNVKTVNICWNILNTKLSLQIINKRDVEGKKRVEFSAFGGYFL